MSVREDLEVSKSVLEQLEACVTDDVKCEWCRCGKMPCDGSGHCGNSASWYLVTYCGHNAWPTCVHCKPNTVLSLRVGAFQCATCLCMIMEDDSRWEAITR